MSLFLPVIVPLAAIMLLLFSHRSVRLQQVISLASMSYLLMHAAIILSKVIQEGPYAMQAGGWPPIRHYLTADLFTAIMLLTTSLLALLVTLYSIGFIGETRKKAGFYVLIHGLVTGVNGSFLTGDIFNLYVWFEVMLISSFVLITWVLKTATTWSS